MGISRRLDGHIEILQNTHKFVENGFNRVCPGRNTRPLAYASRSAWPRHVAAALGPLACPSRSTWPRNELNLT